MNNELLGKLASLAKPQISAPLDSDFRPAVLANRAYRKAVAETGNGVPVVIALDRSKGIRSVYKTEVFAEDNSMSELNLPYIERIVKMLLWQKGGWKLTIGGPKYIADYLSSLYLQDGPRAFDANIMGAKLYEHDFQVFSADLSEMEEESESSAPIGRHLEGCRIGFDLGASDRKAAAVIDGETVFSEEIVWDPVSANDPEYHFTEIMKGLRSAASHMPRVDAIGGSSAGIVLDNRLMYASLLRGIPTDTYTEATNVFLKVAKEWGIPFEVANDGDVTALAGAMSLNSNSVLGVAMGSSEAVGYVNSEGNITGWLNELAFSPIDYNPNGAVDDWSGDIGVGAKYLTQQAVFRLAEKVGIPLKDSDTLAAKLKSVQDLLHAGDENARKIWETIGCYMGYAIAHYAEFYKIDQMLVLGRVTSGDGGAIILEKANEVLSVEFPELASSLELHLPDEKTRRVGQAVAAASLPKMP